MDVYLIGAGGNSKVIIDLCEKNSYKICGVYDDNVKGIFYKNYQVAENIDNIPYGINAVITIGDITAKKSIIKRLKNKELKYVNLFHKNSYISDSAYIGTGNVFLHGSVVNSDSIIGSFNLFNTYSVVEHDCIIGHNNHFAPRSSCCGGVKVGDDNLFGAGVSVIPKIRIGNNNIIGANSVITKDVRNNEKIIKANERI